MVSIQLKIAREQLAEAKKEAWMHEIGNDMYYGSQQKEEDDAKIKHYEEIVKELESQTH